MLRRFKWGMSRLLLESQQRPRVVPIWIEGEMRAKVEDMRCLRSFYVSPPVRLRPNDARPPWLP